MTNEQWLIYLYGIYPEGGFSTIVCVIGILAWIVILPLVEFYGTETLIKRQFKINKFITVIVMITLIIGYFIPSKNVFFSIIAAPYVKESLISKDGKLHKIDSIIDKALNKADTYLSDKKEKQ